MRVFLHPTHPDSHVVLDAQECQRTFRMLTDMVGVSDAVVFDDGLQGFVMPLELYHHLRGARSVVELMDAPPPAIKRPAVVVPTIEEPPPIACRRTVHTQTDATRKTMHAHTQTQSSESGPTTSMVPATRVIEEVRLLSPPPTEVPPTPTPEPLPNDSASVEIMPPPLPSTTAGPPFDTISLGTDNDSAHLDFFLSLPNTESQALGRCLARTPVSHFGGTSGDEHGRVAVKRPRPCPSDVPSGVSDFQVIHRLRLRTDEVISNC